MVHLGWCCASFGAALCENLHAVQPQSGTATGDPKSSFGPIHCCCVTPSPLHGSTESCSCYNVQQAIHGPYWVVLCLFWSSLGWKFACSHRVGQLWETQNPDLGPVQCCCATPSPLNVQRAIHDPSWVVLCLFWSSLGWKFACSHRAGQLRKTQNPAWGPIQCCCTTPSPLHGSTESCYNVQRAIHGPSWVVLCASFGAALGEILHTATERDSYGRLKIQLHSPPQI
jgi:hypothetical protein